MKAKAMHVLAAAVIAAFAGSAISAGDPPKQGASSGAGQPVAKQSDGKQAQRDAKAPQGAPVIVLFPVAAANRDSLGNGCWARLYDGGNFEGNQLSLVGPVDMPTMKTAFGTDWGGEFDSIQVGPKATVTVYDNENFRDKAATFKPGQRIADLGEKMGWFQDVRSLRIACGADGGKK